MATTSDLQLQPDFYESKSECEKSKKIQHNTNKRYKTFKQTHFTAGDEEQFIRYKCEENGVMCNPHLIELDNNIFNNIRIIDSWNKFKNIDATTSMNTFHYIFNKLKKGLFIKIQDNKLKVFLPFSKKKFENEWGKNIKIDPKYKSSYKSSFDSFIEYIQNMEGRTGKIQDNNNNFSEWYANNCLVRYEEPVNEGDSNVGTIKDMLLVLCENKKIPDIELFINRRDFPIIKKDSTEPYDDLFNNIGPEPLKSHNYNKYTPILSVSKTEEYADILMPSYEDWVRVMTLENKFFPDSCSVTNHNFNTEKTHWNTKISTAVFRGATTGCGVTADTNMRIKVAKMSSESIRDTDNVLFLNAEINKWNLRPRKLKGEKYLKTIERDTLGLWAQIPATPEKKINGYKTNKYEREQIRQKNSFMTPEQQSNYKYIIHIDGHVSAFRLSLELSMGSVILLQTSPYTTWYKKMLIPYTHYVPISNDLSDLIQKIKWCKDHDEECFIITQNALRFYRTYLSKEGILDYLQKLFIDIKNETGTYLYNNKTPLDNQLDNEKKLISEFIQKYPTCDTQDDYNIIDIPVEQPRSYGLLKGIQLAINTIHNRISSDIINRNVYTTIEKNKLSEIKKGHLNRNGRVKYPIVIKSSSDNIKCKEMLHETFVGIFGTNEILKKIPNFYYIFALHIDSSYNYNILGEYIEGNTFIKYLKSTAFNFKDYLFLLIQIALSIQVAQDTCGLVHYDLTPWNIILNQKDNLYTVINYPINNRVYKIKTQLLPIIIDYGKSKIIYDNKHYGFINMYKSSSIHDIITILIYSLDEIIKLTSDPQTIENIIKLAKFMKSTYCPQKFLNNIDNFKIFLNKNANFAVLLKSKKYELETLKPIDFVNYIINNFTEYKFEISKTKYFTTEMNSVNSRQVCEYIRSSTIEKKIKSFTDVFVRVKQCSIPLPKNLLNLYYVVQQIEHNLINVNIQMKNFLSSENIILRQYDNLYRNTIYFIITTYDKLIQKYTRQLPTPLLSYEIIGDYSKLQIADYTQESFLLPDFILEKIREYKQYDIKDIVNKKIIKEIILYGGPHKLPDTLLSLYSDHFRELLNIDELTAMNNIANKITLLNTTNEIYLQNLTQIDTEINNFLTVEAQPDCSSIQNYIQNYNIILEQLGVKTYTIEGTFIYDSSILHLYNGKKFFRKMTNLPNELQINKMLIDTRIQNIIKIYGIGKNYIDMEFITKINLTELDTHEIVDLMRKVKSQLQTVGYIYIDWKLDNIGISSEDEEYKLFDFDCSGFIDTQTKEWLIEPMRMNFRHKKLIEDKSRVYRPIEIDDICFEEWVESL